MAGIKKSNHGDKPTSALKELQAHLAVLQEERFYGKVELTLEHGKIVYMKQTQTFRLGTGTTEDRSDG